MFGCASTEKYPAEAADAFFYENYADARIKFIKFLKENPKSNGASRANFQLGVLYFYGLETDPDPAAAFSYFKNVYDGPASEHTSESKHFLAELYLHGKGAPKNIPLAISLYKSVSYPAAQADLAILFWDGIAIDKNHEQVLTILKELDSWGVENYRAKFRRHHTINSRIEHDQNRLAGFPYFQAAIELNSHDLSALTQSASELMAIPEQEAATQYQIALAYLKLKSFSKRLTRAEAWLERSAQQGYAPAQYLYAQSILHNSLPSVLSYNHEWMSYLQSAVEQKHIGALKLMASLYVGCKKPELVNSQEMDQSRLQSWSEKHCPSSYKNTHFDPIKKAQELLRLAVEQGDANTTADLAYILQATNFNNAEKHLAWFQWAANKGYKGANTVLGTIYLKQQKAESNTKAWFWLEQAAKQNDAFAINQLLTMITNGIGVKKSWKDTIYWFEKLDELGDKNSALILGGIYAEGRGNVPANVQKAIHWYKKAINKGNYTGITSLANLYFYPPKGMEKNYSEGVKWLKYGVHKDFQSAKHQLADIHMKPEYRNKNKQNTAIEMYKELVSKGDMQAAYHLGSYYQKKRDVVKTIKWLKIAAAKDHLYAQATLAQFYDNNGNSFEAAELRMEISKRKTDQLKQNEINLVAHSQYLLAMHYYEHKSSPPTLRDQTKVTDLLTL